MLDWAYKKAQERLDPAAWAIVESRVLPKLIQASHGEVAISLAERLKVWSSFVMLSFDYRHKHRQCPCPP